MFLACFFFFNWFCSFTSLANFSCFISIWASLAVLCPVLDCIPVRAVYPYKRKLPYIRKYWRSLNLAICARSGCNLILAKIKFGGFTARIKHSKLVYVNLAILILTAKLKMCREYQWRALRRSLLRRVDTSGSIHNRWS